MEQDSREAWQVEWDERKATAGLDVRTRIDQEITPKKKKRPKDMAAVGPNNVSLGTIDKMVEYLRTPKKKQDLNMLDQLLLSNLLDGVPITEAARIVGMPVSQARARSMELLKDGYSFSQEEMKLITTAQLQRVANMMLDAASKGSDKHAGIILDCIKQLREMYELMNNKSAITIEIITHEQTNVIVTVIGYIIEKFRENPDIARVIDAATFEAIGAEALGEAAELVFQARDREITIDSKGEQVVPSR